MKKNQKSPELIVEKKMVTTALDEAAKILITAFELLEVAGTVVGVYESKSGKKYHLTFTDAPPLEG